MTWVSVLARPASGRKVVLAPPRKEDDMAQHERVHAHEEASPGLLTPAASAIAGLVLAVLSLGGDGIWNLAVSSFLGSSFGDMRPVLVMSGATSLAVALGALWLGRRGMAPHPAGTSWGPQLARAAVLLAGLAVVLAALTIVGGLAGGSLWPGY